MKSKFVVYILAASLICASVSVGMAATWFDDFNLYANNQSLPSPWVTGGTMPLALVASGPDNSTAAYGDDAAKSAFRPIRSADGNTVYGRIRHNGAGTWTRLGVFGSTGNDSGMPSDAQNAVYIDLNPASGSTCLPLISIWESGTQLYSASGPGVAWTSGEWYDVRISWSLDRKTFLFEYKRLKDSKWIQGASITRSSPMSIHYLGFGCKSVAGADDIGFTSVTMGKTPRRIIATRVATAPTIDGNLDDSVWSSTGEFGGFSLELLDNVETQPQAPTFAKVLVDSSAMYIAFRCSEPYMDKLVSRTRGSDDWQLGNGYDDIVQVFLDNNNDRQNTYRLICNPNNALMDSKFTIGADYYITQDHSWNGSWQAQATKSASEWRAEYKIPFSDLGINPLTTDPVLGINLSRYRRAGVIEGSDTSLSTAHVFERPWLSEYIQYMGELVIPLRDDGYFEVNFPSMREVFPGERSIDFQVTNKGNVSSNVKYSYNLTGSSISSDTSPSVMVGVGETVTMHLPLNLIAGNRQRLALRVMCDNTNRVLYKLVREFKVLPALEIEELLFSLYQKRAEAGIYLNVPDALLSNSTLVVSLLPDNSSVPLSTQSLKPTAIVGRPIKVSFDLTGRPQGTYKLSAELRKNQATVASATSRNYPYNPSPEQSFTSDGVMLVNGTPWFPIGIYHPLPDSIKAPGVTQDQVLTEMKDAGFNTVFICSQPWNDILPQLDACSRIGMKAFATPSATLTHHWSGDAKALRSDVITRMNHPALIGYYQSDEPLHGAWNTVDSERQIYQTIKETDTNHPTLIVDAQARYAQDMRACSDIFGVDGYGFTHGQYPFFNGPATFISDKVQASKAAIEKYQPGRPLWVVLQGFDSTIGRTGSPNDGGLRPTPDETRAMAYLSVIHGAKGVFWWTYNWSPKWYMPHWPTFWNAIKQTAGELNVLSPALLTSDVDSGLSFTPSTATIDTMVKRVGNETYVLAANPGFSTVTPTFRLPGLVPGSTIQVMFESRNVTSSGEYWSDSFSSLAVHVYKITSP